MLISWRTGGDRQAKLQLQLELCQEHFREYVSTTAKHCGISLVSSEDQVTSGRREGGAECTIYGAPWSWLLAVMTKGAYGIA